MKKSLIALLLVVALVVTVSVFAVSADEINPFEGKTIDDTVMAPCPYCSPSADVEWKPLATSLDTALTFGHYFLVGETNQTAHTGLSAEGTLCLELNGFNYNRTNSGHPFAIAGESTVFNIFDSSTEKTGKIQNTYSNPNSVNAIQLSKGMINQYGGTINMPNNTTATKVNGSCLKISGGTYNMYGGGMSGRNVWAGGCISMSGGIFNMYEGTTISGQSAGNGGALNLTSGEFNMMGGTFTGCNVPDSADQGGAVYASGGTFVMTGGTIEDCHAGRGGAICYTSNGSVEINGGTIRNCYATNRAGGIFALGTSSVQLKNELLIKKGTIQNCYVTGGNLFGGNIYLEFATATISGGTIENGGKPVEGATVAAAAGQLGGNICIRGAGSSVTVKDNAIIQNGEAKQGGNIYLGAGTLNVEGGTISGGNATGDGGGNIYSLIATCEVNVSDGTITKGTALAGSGGNVYMKLGTFEMTGGTISGGLDTVNARHSGNLYLGAGSVGNIYGGTITGGKCTFYGGNIYAYDAQLTIDADEGKTVKITKGTVGTNGAGGNIYIRTADTNVTSSATITGPDVTISGGDDGSKIGGSPYVDSDDVGTQCGCEIMLYGTESKPCTLTVSDVTIDAVGSGNAYVHTNEITMFRFAELNVADEAYVDCAYILDDTSRVTVQEGFTGNLWVRWHDSTITSAVAAGAATDPTLWQETGYVGTGTVYVCGSGRSQKILADTGDAVEADAEAGTEADNAFKVAAFSGVKADPEGNVTKTPIENLDTAGQYDFVTPYFDGEYTLSDHTTIDINNATLHINTGNYKLSLIEQRTNDFDDAADYNTKGYVTVDTEANVETVVRENAYGCQYITVPTGTTEAGLTKFTAHRVKVDIDSVNIKPASAALYYTTNMDTTPTASKFAYSYGVVLSLADMPDKNFVSDTNKDEVTGKDVNENLYTEIDFEEFADGARVDVNAANSALLEGILNKGDNVPAGQNKAWGEMPIFANAFICFNINGEDHYVMADQTYELSLLDILTIVNETAPSHASVLKMYENWQDPMYQWATEAQPNEQEPRLAAIKAAYDEANA